MYQIIVNSTGWDQKGGKLDATRIFEYTNDELVLEFKPDGKLNIEKIKNIPTIFASETGSQGKQIIKFGHIVDVEIVKNIATIQAFYDESMPVYSNQQFEKVLDELNIDGFEMNRNHWAIKNINLYQMLLRNGAKLGAFRPKLFNLDDLYEPNKKLISAMMPFNGAFSKVYETFKACAKKYRMECLRADDIWEDDVIINDVVKLICNPRIVICDCTDRNPNVFYEIGIAHALGKEVILVTQNQNDVPFDLRHIRFIKYLNNDQGLAELSDSICKRIDTILEKDD